MYERSYGKKYDAKLGTKEIAAKFREDVKAAQKSGALPKALKLSVRIKRFSGGSSIDVDVVAIDIPLFSRAWLERDPSKHFDRPNCERRNPEFAALLNTLESMLQAYNHDGSDAMVDYFDVKFYGHVGVGYDFEKACEEKEKAALATAPVAKLASVPRPVFPSPDTDEAAAERLRIGMLEQEKRDQAAAKMEGNEDPLTRAF